MRTATSGQKTKTIERPYANKATFPSAARALAINTIDPRADLFWGLLARAAVTKNHPVRPFGVNLLWRKPLVLPIVPLHEIALDMYTVAESRQLASFAGPMKPARENQGKGLLGENGLEKSGGRAPVLCERNICHAGVLPAQAPLGFPWRTK